MIILVTLLLLASYFILMCVESVIHLYNNYTYNQLLTRELKTNIDSRSYCYFPKKRDLFFFCISCLHYFIGLHFSLKFLYVSIKLAYISTGWLDCPSEYTRLPIKTHDCSDLKSLYIICRSHMWETHYKNNFIVFSKKKFSLYLPYH
jgi:hypothetical protein